ncbi:MAG TPA: TrmO family methyltransferase [Spirochaetota bacterium]|nr:TrmO family methyltransferase [Spirochaetota bacterium]HRT74095.1 TrmO family methyltransferase [Spirochaetota bacterium]
MDFTIHSIGTVINGRHDVSDDFWGGIVSEIRLDPSFSEDALAGIEAFSHLEIIFVFHEAVNGRPLTGSGRPRENTRWPETGIFAQRKKTRPNFIGTAMATLVKKEGTSIFVRDLDAINGTPVMDIKPVMKGFLPRGPVTQPAWADEIMEDYWKDRGPGKTVPIILEDLLRAVDDHCDFAHYYLDRETGEIIFQSERELDDLAADDDKDPGFNPEYLGERFIPIEPMESRRGHGIIRKFIGTLPGGSAAGELIRALSMRKSFAQFKDALHNHADLEEKWRADCRDEIKRVAEEWLRYYGIDFEFISLKDPMK